MVRILILLLSFASINAKAIEPWQVINALPAIIDLGSEAVDGISNVLSSDKDSNSLLNLFSDDQESEPKSKENSLGHLYYKSAIKDCRANKFTKAYESFKKAEQYQYINSADTEFAKCSGMTYTAAIYSKNKVSTNNNIKKNPAANSSLKDIRRKYSKGNIYEFDYSELTEKLVTTEQCGKPMASASFLTCVSRYYLLAKNDIYRAYLWNLYAQSVSPNSKIEGYFLGQIKNKFKGHSNDDKMWQPNDWYKVNTDFTNIKKSFDPEAIFISLDQWADQGYKLAENKSKTSKSKQNANNLKSGYINRISNRIRNNWIYKGAKDYWGCDVYITQDRDGKVLTVDVVSCKVDNWSKVKSFKNSIERAVYKSSPLPSAPDSSVFDKEVMLFFRADSSSDKDNEFLFTENSSNKNSETFISSSVKSDPDKEGPKISLNHPAIFNTTESNFNIAGKIYDNSKVADLKIDGEVVNFKNNAFSLTRYIQLGKNNINIQATDIKGNISNLLVSITRTKPEIGSEDKKLIPPSRLSKTNPNAVALIIGVDNYESISRAEWAESDANYFYDYANTTLGIPHENIKITTGKGSDYRGIWKSIEQWLPAYVSKDQTDLFIYFAGHGLASSNGEDVFLLPWDADPELLYRTAIKQSELVSAVNKLRPKNVTMFLDTCYSGNAKGGKKVLTASRGLRIVKKDNLRNVPKNFNIFSAAGSDETAISHPTLKNGLFSYWLMRGLNKEADKNNDDEITTGELHQFVSEKVSKSAISLGQKQNPQLYGNQNKTISSW